MPQVPFIKYSKQGFSLIELTVTTAILGIIAYAAMSVFELKSQADIEDKYRTSLNELYLNTKLQLSNPKTCMTSFSGIDVSSLPVELESLSSFQGQVFLRTIENKRAGYKIEKIKITRIIHYPLAISDGEMADAIIDLEVVARSTKLKKQITQSRKIPISLRVQQKKKTKKILDCNTGSGNAQLRSLVKSCLSLGGKVQGGICNLNAPLNDHKILSIMCKTQGKRFNPKTRKCTSELAPKTKVRQYLDAEECFGPFTNRPSGMGHYCCEAKLSSSGCECLYWANPGLGKRCPR